MTFAAILTILVVLGVLVTLATTRVPPDVLLMAAVTVLIVGGAITPIGYQTNLMKKGRVATACPTICAWDPASVSSPSR